MILPGSAKGQYVVPESMHHMQLTPAGLVHPRVQAGDVVLFLAYAPTRLSARFLQLVSIAYLTNNALAGMQPRTER